MTCNRCGNDEVPRSRRRGMWDRIQRIAGNWPYRCDDCGYRFFARHRNPQFVPETPAEARHSRPYGAQTSQPAPDMAFQTHSERPHAKIVVQADTHEQLNDILLALSRAVNSYGPSTRPETGARSQQETASSARR